MAPHILTKSNYNEGTFYSKVPSLNNMTNAHRVSTTAIYFLLIYYPFFAVTLFYLLLMHYVIFDDVPYHFVCSSKRCLVMGNDICAVAEH